MNAQFSPSARTPQHPRIKAKSRNKNSRDRRRILGLEILEDRSMMALLVADVLSGTPGTSISGTVYEDVNSNGVRDGGEDGIAGWKVYLDLDNSGTLNNDAAGTQEPSAITNGDGDYSINRLIPNTYRISEVVQSGWTATAPVSQDVIVNSGKTTKADFFNFSGGDIAGTVWNDLNHNGIRATDPVSGAFTEPGLAGWTVFLDLDNDRLPGADEPFTITAADGSYSFIGLPPDDYEVTEVLPDGWDVTSGFDFRETASVVARQRVVQDFANFSTTNGSIQGVIWNDTNANGVRETDPLTGEFTEPGLADWTVFLDDNNNNTLDVGEISTATDADGSYSFISLVAGDYEVVEVLLPGWAVSPTFDVRQTVTVVGGNVSAGDDFANFTALNGSIRGTVWNDLNRNSLRDVNTLTGDFLDPGLANWTIYIDLNRNRLADPTEPTTLTDVNGNYAFADLQVGEYQVMEVLPTGWEASPTFGDNHTVIVYSGAESVAPDFANYNLAVATPGSVSGTVWNDLNGNGVRDINPTTGAFSDPGLSGWTIFVDANSDRLLNVGELQATSAADGTYTLTGVLPGTVTILVQPTAGWRATAPLTNSRTIALRSGDTAIGLDFGEAELRDSSIRGTVYADTNGNQARNTGERGLGGITVYLDLNNNSALDIDEPQVQTSADLYYTPGVDEAGSYSFTHLASGTYTVRQVVPATLSATPLSERAHSATITAAVGQTGVDFADVYRANEIHGVKFDDVNGNHIRDAGEAGVAGATIYIDLDRDNFEDADEPHVTTSADGSYSFTNLTPGAYVVRQVVPIGHTQTSPATVGGNLWPSGVSNPAVGNVNPLSITTSLAKGVSHRQSVSLTLPNTGALTNLVDVFLLFDDTGSFVSNSPIVRAAFPNIIAQLQTSLPGIDLGFGVGRLEEYANFASEYATGRPFILNQPIVAASSTGYLAAIQAALNRTTPGYGGDQPETDIEALYQLVTGRGFDGNNNGSFLDSGAAGLASTQLNPGSSGDVPSFASFVADPVNNVLPAAGNIGGAGFRSGALPIILLATDTGFAYQPQGETSVIGVGGVTVSASALTQTSRATTPFNSGAGLQQTITGLNALGALVIGLGTNPQATLDPRQGLEAISKLTGATNQSTATIANGTADPIAPGDPLYFQIASGFGASVANGVTSAIQNAVTNVAVDIELQASDPRVHIINHTGTLRNIGSGSTATFDVEFVGDGIPHRFDLQFVRAGTNVVLGSIPVVLGTPIPGDCYEFDDLEEGEIEIEDNFGSRLSSAVVNPTWQGVDGANWSTAGSWTGTVPNSATAEAQYTTTGGAIANLDIDHTINKLTFDATTSNDYTISGPGKLTLAGTTPSISTTVGNTGDQTVAVNLDLAASTTITVNGGSLSLNAPTNATLGAGITATVASGATLNLGGAGNALSNGTSTHADVTNNGTLAATTAGKRVGNISGTGTTTVSAAGATLTANHVRQAGLTIGAGNNVTVATNGGDSGVSRVTALSINATGQLDLNNNDLIVDNGNLAALTTLLKTGLDITGAYGGGPGITSTTFAANPLMNTALGVATNAELGFTTFSGQTVDGNDILVKYTYFGDADLNGVVDTATDFDLYITGLTSGGSLGGWLYGDFDYNGVVDSVTDFDLYITGLTSQGGALLTAGPTSLSNQAAPEPNVWVLGDGSLPIRSDVKISPIQQSSASGLSISTPSVQVLTAASGVNSMAVPNLQSTAYPRNYSANVFALNSSDPTVKLTHPSSKFAKSKHNAPRENNTLMQKAKEDIRSSIFAELGQSSSELTNSTITKRTLDVDSENDLWNEPAFWR